MDGSLSPNLDSRVSKELKPRRKVVQKTVVRVKIDANVGKHKNEGPPSDSWSWRKYGQKPIKGSPYPRGYYRCSTSKGCSAKKQVERCRTDASMLVITYTSSHNHPGPDLHTTNPTQHPKESQTQPIEEIPTTPKQEQEQNQEQQQQQQQQQEQDEEQPIIMTSDEDASEDHFHYFQPPIRCSQDIIINQEENPFTESLESTHGSLGLLLDEEPLSYPHLMTFSTPKSEENDFFDELGELPTSSSFTSFMRNNFFDERILVLPS